MGEPQEGVGHDARLLLHREDAFTNIRWQVLQFRTG